MNDTVIVIGSKSLNQCVIFLSLGLLNDFNAAPRREVSNEFVRGEEKE